MFDNNIIYKGKSTPTSYKQFLLRLIYPLAWFAVANHGEKYRPRTLCNRNVPNHATRSVRLPCSQSFAQMMEKHLP